MAHDNGCLRFLRVYPSCKRGCLLKTASFGRLQLLKVDITVPVGEDGICRDQRWQLEIVLEVKLLGATLVGDRANSASPDFILLVLSVQLQQFLMLLKVIHLLFHVD